MTLVVLAAGMGSRYGGMKQIDPFTKEGEFIIDFSVYDAVKAGFDKVVFIIKEEMLDDFKETVGKRVSPFIKVDYAFQKMDKCVPSHKIPKERVKPWGTTHALLCAKDAVTDNFAVTETANEFSTFAKLYSEDPVLIDLDKTLKDQLLIFDNKDNIRIQYIGQENAFVMAPKPQLIRVFVNLITNAVQAVEIHQKEQIEKGEDPGIGRVLICLRNSTKNGYYDIVFDDNGPGVSDDNLDRLFTPNFTTKSSGTGLGLAICRNIIEKCEGEIRYQKSFALGGASFIVTIPKHTA